MTSYYVSTPAFTVRVDVAAGRIHETTARYLFRSYGQSWERWLRQQRQRWGGRLRVTELGERLLLDFFSKLKYNN